MNLKVFNESFSKYYTEGADITETNTSFTQELKNALEGDVRHLKDVHQTNPMLQAYKLQATIEELVPDKSWWEVTDCNINGELGNGLPLDKIVDCIIDNLKPEYTNTNESFNKSINEGVIYDEPELLGKGYAAPTSLDYAKEVNLKLKHNALEDLENIQEYMNQTISRVEEFDEYWNAHKAAIMKNIKEAQDLIPTEYRA